MKGHNLVRTRGKKRIHIKKNIARFLKKMCATDDPLQFTLGQCSITQNEMRLDIAEEEYVPKFLQPIP